ncbi:class I SAM-dependent methyltransferase [Modestobacter marinus]|uniref:2-polyprenyl-3-methyl-5-hydroxy-6-metoxy-1, 4-benzoquinol methylase n=1 Tax=Modestobacter marinus TaxID=477641 RepID=A0A846LR88_9ACTN|nr:class I SAM-dependent methyltransferase [Modestobacter marinus]NIH68974.1 2-polyprenyl-3-methyl-5-hydroxy-6-metoxy-1,4-benzoquinol methylase [Modestobacter marinus]GGL78527.1 SAM-dependent methyltransferase [Modestobacter marinus]
MTTTLTTLDEAEVLSERLFGAAVQSLELFAVHLGRRLGLYRVLADGRARTAAELAADAGIAERYAREWLDQQAVAGLLDTDDGEPSTGRRYRLGAAHARVLTVADDPLHAAPLASMLAGIGQALPDVVEAYRSGGGVPYARYGEDFRDGQGGVNRPAFTHDLVQDWLPAVPDVHSRLASGARVADVGCGQGWSTQAIARAYPASTVVGVDVDAGSVADAAATLDDDLADRVSYVVADAARLDALGVFDVVVMLETLHDIGRPVEALAAVRAALADGGTLVVADERVAPSFSAPGDEVERMMLGWSVVHCLPAAIATGDHDAIGTAIRPSVVVDLARQAGFGTVEVLPIDNPLFRFYRIQD